MHIAHNYNKAVKRGQEISNANAAGRPESGNDIVVWLMSTNKATINQMSGCKHVNEMNVKICGETRNSEPISWFFGWKLWHRQGSSKLVNITVQIS